MAGRPSLKTEDTIRKIEEVAALDGSIEEMAYYAGIHRDTLYGWLQDDKDFSDRITSLRERPILKARQTVVKSLDDPIQAFKYLERKKKSEFAVRVEQTGAGGKDLPTPIAKLERSDILGNDSLSEDSSAE